MKGTVKGKVGIDQLRKTNLTNSTAQLHVADVADKEITKRQALQHSNAMGGSPSVLKCNCTTGCSDAVQRGRQCKCREAGQKCTSRCGCHKHGECRNC